MNGLCALGKPGLLLAVLATGSCGGGDPGTVAPALLSVSGSYQTAVSLLQSTCQGTQVQTFATTVAHVPGASVLSLSHAGSTYPGTVDTNGTFRSPESNYVIGSTTYRIGIQGTFSATAMDATVTVQPQIQPPCQFSARWQGPKSGPPNVIF